MYNTYNTNLYQLNSYNFYIRLLIVTSLPPGVLSLFTSFPIFYPGLGLPDRYTTTMSEDFAKFTLLENRRIEKVD